MVLLLETWSHMMNHDSVVAVDDVTNADQTVPSTITFAHPPVGHGQLVTPNSVYNVASDGL